MERLTSCAEGGGITVADLPAALERLAAYENIGLGPTELRDLKDAWDMYGGEDGITRALRHPQGWISVEERLPGPFETVLICIRTRNGYGQECHDITVGGYDTTSGTWQEYTAADSKLAEGEAVTHWMPLPEEPGETQTARSCPGRSVRSMPQDPLAICPEKRDR